MATGHGAFALLSCHGKGIMLHFPCMCLSAMLYSASPMRMGGKGPHTFCRQNLRIVPKESDQFFLCFKPGATPRYGQVVHPHQGKFEKWLLKTSF